MFEYDGVCEACGLGHVGMMMLIMATGKSNRIDATQMIWTNVETMTQYDEYTKINMYTYKDKCNFYNVMQVTLHYDPLFFCFGRLRPLERT